VSATQVDPTRREASTEPVLTLRNVSKIFGAQRALDDVSIEVLPGRVTALLGQNGSGKSTLIKILAGFYVPEPGAELTIGGKPIELPVRPQEVHEAGVRFLHQDLALVADFSISDNFALANGYPTKRGFARIGQRRYDREVGAVLREFGVDASPSTKISGLAPAERTMVAIARAFGSGDSAGRIIVLDEPTASLPETEVERIFAALRTATAAGAAAIYVSHRIDEVRQIADDVLVLRDGRLVAAQQLGDMGNADIVSLILGRKLEEMPSVSHLAGEADGKDVVVRARNIQGRLLRDISFDLKRGELLGVTGLLGCGRSELARMLAGAQTMHTGEIELDGREVRPRTPADALAERIAYIPQDRHADGVIGEMTLRENLTLATLGDHWAHGHISRRSEISAATEMIKKFDIRPPLPDRKMANLSGGNQQKAILARCIATQPKLIVLDEPTQGVDAGAKQEIGSVVLKLAEEGTGIVLCSSDYAELSSLCTRVLVLDRGRVVADLTGASISEDQLTAASAATSSTANKATEETDG
jgi:ribose transport system ATP-binding protein